MIAFRTPLICQRGKCRPSLQESVKGTSFLWELGRGSLCSVADLPYPCRFHLLGTLWFIKMKPVMSTSWLSSGCTLLLIFFSSPFPLFPLEPEKKGKGQACKGSFIGNGGSGLGGLGVSTQQACWGRGWLSICFLNCGMVTMRSRNFEYWKEASKATETWKPSLSGGWKQEEPKWAASSKLWNIYLKDYLIAFFLRSLNGSLLQTETLPPGGRKRLTRLRRYKGLEKQRPARISSPLPYFIKRVNICLLEVGRRSLASRAVEREVSIACCTEASGS